MSLCFVINSSDRSNSKSAMQNYISSMFVISVSSLYSAALLVSYCITLAVCTGDENGFISFAVSTLSTAEDSNGLYTGVNLPFIREGGTTDTVTVTFRVRDVYNVV